VLRENSTMLAMCQSLGFKTKLDPDDPTVMVVTLPVQDASVALPPEGDTLGSVGFQTTADHGD
jgi:acetyltransferase